MLKNIASIAATAIVVATFATTTVQAKQIVADTPACERVVAPQKLAKVQAPYVFLVLGVAY
jgi:hypothetical protein